ncbi:hypothetical protein HPP92_014831 [Vanilla planifolia]|uniref:Uncharacterized protein n=1 Tax=Vanilla planifolia TaxID=51239 RepID=A0A835QKS8_VANPL|nr:hypothetical protein HPP92_014831 [Vanilla planifolia]
MNCYPNRSERGQEWRLVGHRRSLLVEKPPQDGRDHLRSMERGPVAPTRFLESEHRRRRSLQVIGIQDVFFLSATMASSSVFPSSSYSSSQFCLFIL